MSEEPLPPGFAAIWGLRDRTRPGPKPGLSIERILKAAVAVADAEGLPALSMSRLAKELGFTTMSLYRHVANKDELLVLLYDEVMGPPPPLPGGGWRADLESWSRGLMTAYRRHLWAARMPVGGGGPPITPNQLLWMDQGLSVLAGMQLAEAEKGSTLLLLSGHVRTWALLEDDLTRAGMANAEAGGPDWDYARLLRLVVDPAKAPAVAAALAAGAFDDEGGDEEFIGDEFEFGLQRVLDGLERYMER